jgi:hypothetical protein
VEDARLLLINMDCFEIQSHFETFRLLCLRRPFFPVTTVVLHGKKRKGLETPVRDFINFISDYYFWKLRTNERNLLVFD